MKYGRCIFPAVCGVASVVVFVGMFLFIHFSIVKPLYLMGLLFLVPVLAFVLLTVMAYQGRISAVIANGITAVLIPVFMVMTTFLLFHLAFSEAAEPVEDPRYYARAYGMYSEDSAVATAFPERIPDGAEDVRFHYHWQFLQGGGEFSLAYTDDPAKLAPIIAELAEKAVWCGSLSEFGGWDERPSYFNGESFWGTYDIPDDATVYLIDYRNPYGEDEDGYDWWNHGEYVIAAVSERSGEVVYRHCYW